MHLVIPWFSPVIYLILKTPFALGQGLFEINWSCYSAESTNSCLWWGSFALPVCGCTGDVPPAATEVKKPLQVNTLTPCT